MYRIYLLITFILLSSCDAKLPGIMIVAHRGASYDAPENTIPAFLLAWEQGADAIEGDFFLTADGEIVCIHDPRTSRVSDTDTEVATATLEELKQLDAGSWKGEQWAGTTIPTLGEVFEIVPPGKKIFVEIKSGTEILPVLCQELDRSALSDEQIVIISFNADVIEGVKSSRPEHNAYWLSGLSQDDHGNVVPDVKTVIETLERTGADGFSSHHGLVTAGYIEQIMDAGYEYHVWTVNDPERAWELRQHGVLSVTTDIPGRIRDYFGIQKSQ
jgi:glycerophosphoryl diester phosphodiesterase